MKQQAEVLRKTKETDIVLTLSRVPGTILVDTGVGFFDHMLHALAFHGGLSLTVRCRGDLQVDAHHTVEDVGIALGQALAELLGDRSGIRRFGSAVIPMDEALGFAAVDVSGRPYLVYDGEMPQAASGAYEYCLNEEFFRAFAVNGGLTLHLKAVYGRNAHHMTEALFKAAARALREALTETGEGVASTKGVL